jgi:hypothetical protein
LTREKEKKKKVIAMRGPIKKRKINHVNTPDQLTKIIFALVWPWLYPGHWKTKKEGFKTLLALCGTCQQLRYFQRLRRLVVQLAPVEMTERLRDHGFPAHFSVHFWMDLIHSKRISSSTFYFYPDHLRETPVFFGTATFQNLAKRSTPLGSTLVFFAPSFAELVLFVYAVAVVDDTELGKFQHVEAYLTIKSGHYENILFTVLKKTDFIQRFAIGHLKHIGLLCERDFTFEKGALQETAYSFFCRVCETNGRKDKKKPIDRLKDFVEGWFPVTPHSVGPNDKKKRAYEFEMDFKK